MKLKIDVFMDYALEQDDPALLMVSVANTSGQTVLDSALTIDGASQHWIDDEATHGRRVWAVTEAERLTLRYRATVEITRPDVDLSTLGTARWHALPGDVLPFVRPSRLCPSDRLVPFVAKQFGHLRGGAKIAAMRDWTADWLSYVPGSSDALTTAIDTFVTREGVCRDYAHLMCGLARAANIPARYTTGYGADVTPPDFHAVAEIWLEGAWHLVDPTGMSGPSGLAIIGSGRDAGEVTFMETEKWATYIDQRVTVKQA